ncbi:hypothetical protein HLH33_15795 [Gluconacetobacter diazotrophicus]|uniref:Helix-turn-helix domain-containing protein n=1 Tax=Gluconacetobacter diazotrophicus TaxID=33996 RepID=A0A7W4I7J6_GLUDI|nr:hypothetical protein [Gluconacetobacter diazotrophicus]MBB2157750.1 hypothetical protein [Gluconacetobacter diazotrophicus]
MKHQEKETPKLVMLRASERTLLDRDEACKVLGIEPGTMRKLNLLGCGAPSLKVRNVRLYRREDILVLRERWMAAVDVNEQDRLARRRRRDESCGAEKTDPLMMLLAHRTMIDRLVIRLFWSMIIFGGLICLILY